ncbi:MAG: TetR/AcrR family transcriptional regulator [Myxococcales bacterium]|nr:TetR/AcrR family transcriptional regulator [Myxococcales bacterium]MDH3483546.1 TetR/AcrR family transcriptional regulator [Myxococcales bacterium]
MPRASLTEEQVEVFRTRAVGAATALFADLGYQGVTLRALAAELGVSPMTPYRYFKNKEELFAMVRADAFRRFADAQRDASNGIEDPAEALHALGMAYVTFALNDPDAYHIMFELRQAPAGTYPELETSQARAFSYLLAAVEGVIDAGLMDGKPVQQAHFLWARVHGLVSLHLAGKLAMGCSLEDLLPEVFEKLQAANRSA